jgi:hypothetical protein
MKVKLTDTGIRSYRPGSKPYAFGDEACPGLCIRITPNGARTFAFVFRAKGSGKTVWLTLGRYPDVGWLGARAGQRRPQDHWAGGVPATAARRGEGAFRNFETRPPSRRFHR